MKFLTVNLKENNPTVEEALANFQISLEENKTYACGIKFIHGYGSHGRGGNILLALNKFLPVAKKKGLFKDYIKGIDWTINNQKTFNFITANPEASLDCDLNSGNVGITIIIL